MNEEKFENYIIAKTWRRILARIIDIIIISLIPLFIVLISYFINKNNISTWWEITGQIFINFILLFIYFIIIPWKFDGQTLGKKICFIRLINEDKKITIKKIIIRELYLVFIPVILTMFTFFIVSVILNTNIAKINPNTTSGFWINVFIRFVFSFVFAWYLGIMIVTKIDKKHQLFYDRKNQIYVVSKNPINIKKTNKEKEKELVHVHLGTNQPGNIDNDELKNIQDL